MQTLTAERVRATNAPGAPRIVTCLGASAFTVAAAWFRLATKGVTVATAPRTGPDAALQQAIGAGSLLWITGSAAELGGHRAVGLSAVSASPPPPPTVQGAVPHL